MDEAFESRLGGVRIIDELRPRPKMRLQFRKERDTNLIVSEGVTAITASVIPAPRPAGTNDLELRTSGTS